MGEVIGQIQGIATTSDLPSLIIKAVLILIVVGFAIWGAIKAKNVKIDAARTSEQTSAQNAETQTTQQSTTVNQQIQSDSQRADDFLNS